MSAEFFDAIFHGANFLGASQFRCSRKSLAAFLLALLGGATKKMSQNPTSYAGYTLPSQGLQILLMSGVTVTFASQILGSFWKIWSQVSQRKKPFSDFTARGPGMNNYRDGYTV